MGEERVNVDTFDNGIGGKERVNVDTLNNSSGRRRGLMWTHSIVALEERRGLM